MRARTHGIFRTNFRQSITKVQDKPMHRHLSTSREVLFRLAHVQVVHSEYPRNGRLKRFFFSRLIYISSRVPFFFIQHYMYIYELASFVHPCFALFRFSARDCRVHTVLVLSVLLQQQRFSAKLFYSSR